MENALEKQYRLPEASDLSGYSVAALRKKMRLRQLGYRKTGRIVTIPQSELSRLLGGISASCSTGRAQAVGDGRVVEDPAGRFKSERIYQIGRTSG